MNTNEVYITHIFDAAPSVVFNYWTDPELLLQWYAPKGCSIRYLSNDIRPGGRFHSCITTPDKKQCWCAGEYLEIVKNEKLVFVLTVCDENGQPADPVAMGMDKDWPKETTVTVQFFESGGKTRLTLHQTVSEELAKRTGAHPSWIMQLAQLNELIQKKG